MGAAAKRGATVEPDGGLGAMGAGPGSVGADPWRGRRVLVVDDEKFIRVILSRMLSELGLEVVGSAGDGREAVEKCAALSPDIVTLDIAMPEMDGLAALRAIMARQPQVRVLMASSYGDPRLVAEAMRTGARGYLTKPFDLAAIREKLDLMYAAPHPAA